MTIIQLEMTKAFHAIPHDVIDDALRKKDIPETMVKLITDAYKDIHTNIKQVSMKIPKNIKKGGYQKCSGTKVSSLAFANDFILFF
jgi:hypothetical protein